MAIRNTSDLRLMLIETIEGVVNGKIEPKVAHAVGNLSAKVLQSAKLDLDVLKYNTLNEGAVKAGEQVLRLVNG